MIQKFLGFFMLAFMLAGCAGSNAPVKHERPSRVDSRPLRPASLPEFRLATTGGKTITCKKLDDRVALIMFFTTGSYPCRIQMVEYTRLISMFRGKPLTVIAASLDESNVAKLKKFMKEFAKSGKPVRYAVGIPGKGMVSAFGAIRGIPVNSVGYPGAAAAGGSIHAVPTAFLVDRLGKVRRRFVGAYTADQIGVYVRPLLKGRGKRK